MSTRPEHYTVGWICAIPIEYVVACELLDEQYGENEIPEIDTRCDSNAYTFGRIHKHHAVIACLPRGRYGTTSAAIVASHMQSSFPALRFGLMVGIAGGAPSFKHDIRLGDVVVSSPTPRHGGVIQYDFGKAMESLEFEETGHLAPPPTALLTALAQISMQHERKGHKIIETINHMLDRNKRLRARYQRPSANSDNLYEASPMGIDQLLIREPRGCDEDDPAIHYGLIASANRVMKDRTARDALMAKHDVLCFEMEAAGLMNDFPCVVIKGICDYSDGHKNDEWQGYAAATAAAYARELLSHVPVEVAAQVTKGSENSSPPSQAYGTGHTEADVSIDTTLMTPDPRFVLSDTSANNFSSSMNHGIQTHTIHGDINYHYNSHESQVTQQYKQLDSEASKDVLLLRADAAIREYYESTERLKIERLSGETLPLEKCYINLTLIDTSNGKHEDDKPSFSLQDRLQLVARDATQGKDLSKLFGTQVNSKGVSINPRRIFIRGRAGIGKTTLCKKIVHEFLHDKLGEDLFDRLLWLPLRSLENRDKGRKYSWLEVLQDAFPLSSQVENWENLEATMAHRLSSPDFRRKTLFLLDGLDEVSRHWRKEDKLFGFLEDLICNSPNIIITSRPQANSLKIGSFDLELETIGFIPEQINTYINHCIRNEQTRKSMKNLIAAKPLLQGLLRIPVQLDAFCCTWLFDKGENSVSTMTTLYSSISVELWRKDLLRTGKHDRPQILDDVDVLQLVSEERKLLEVYGFQGLINSVIEFSPQHQQIIKSHVEQSEGVSLPLSYKLTLEQLSFLRTSDVHLHQAKRNCHFLHLTFQEFFAANYFVRCWLSDTVLTYLDLGSATRERRTISPADFVQIEKYNPRLNIFWRFVTGLTQIQSCEKMTVISFFDQLAKEPIDLLGIAHRRLLMYCLSEVILEKTKEFEELRDRVELLLHHGAIEEYHSSDRLVLGTETEFPEGILLSLLRKNNHPLQEAVYSALQARSWVSTEILCAVFRFAIDNCTVHLQLMAADVVLKNSRIDTQELVTEATKTIYSSLKDKDLSVQKSAIKAAKYRLSLSEQVIDTLLALLEDEDFDVQYYAQHVLKDQSPLPDQTVNTLFALFQDKDKDVFLRGSAIEVLRKQSSLPKEVAYTLLELFKDKDEDSFMRRNAIEALSWRSSLPKESMDALFTLVKDKDEDSSVRENAVGALSWQWSLPEESINVLHTLVKDKDEDSVVRRSALEALSRQSSLPEEVIDTLLTLFKDKDEDSLLRVCAIGTFKDHSSSSEQAISTLLVLFKDEYSRVQEHAAFGVRKQYNLSTKVIDALLVLLQKRKSDVQSHATWALGWDSPLLGQALDVVLALLENKDTESDVRNSIMIRLGSISSLPERALNVLLALLKDKEEDSRVRDYAAKGLRKQSSLAEEIINALLTLFKDESRKDVYEILRQHTSLYSIIKELEVGALQWLWSIWLGQGVYEDTCCFELGDSLFLWSNGVKHKITDQRAETQKFLEAIGNKRSKLRLVALTDVDDHSELVTESRDNVQMPLLSE